MKIPLSIRRRLPQKISSAVYRDLPKWVPAAINDRWIKLSREIQIYRGADSRMTRAERVGFSEALRRRFPDGLPKRRQLEPCEHSRTEDTIMGWPGNSQSVTVCLDCDREL